MAFIDSTVVNVALPAVQANFRATVVDVQWVVESYGLFLGALILVGGSLGDLFGRRLMFVVGVAIFAVASGGLRRCLEHFIGSSSRGAFKVWELHSLCPAALRLSVHLSTRRTGAKRSARGRALRRSPPRLVRFLAAGWLSTLPGGGCSSLISRLRQR